MERNGGWLNLSDTRLRATQEASEHNCRASTAHAISMHHIHGGDSCSQCLTLSLASRHVACAEAAASCAIFYMGRRRRKQVDSHLRFFAAAVGVDFSFKSHHELRCIQTGNQNSCAANTVYLLEVVLRLKWQRRREEFLEHCQRIPNAIVPRLFFSPTAPRLLCSARPRCTAHHRRYI